jgi:hypothetical protein
MFIKVQYDAFNRTFKLVDSEFRTLLEGDAVYDLMVPLISEDDEQEFVVADETFVAHA